MDRKYSELTSLIRRTQVKALHSQDYPHFRSPNARIKNLPPLRKHVFDEEKFKLTYLFRPGMETGNNQRNLDAGRIEIILEYKGVFKSDSIEDGFILNEEKGLRVIAGTYIEHAITKEFAKYQNNYLVKDALAKGDYKRFTELSMKEANFIIESTKKFYREHPGARKFD